MLQPSLAFQSLEVSCKHEKEDLPIRLMILGAHIPRVDYSMLLWQVRLCKILFLDGQPPIRSPLHALEYPSMFQKDYSSMMSRRRLPRGEDGKAVKRERSDTYGRVRNIVR